MNAAVDLIEIFECSARLVQIFMQSANVSYITICP